MARWSGIFRSLSLREAEAEVAATAAEVAAKATPLKALPGMPGEPLPPPIDGIRARYKQRTDSCRSELFRWA